MKVQYEVDTNGNLTGKSRIVSAVLPDADNWHAGWVNDGFANHRFVNGHWVGDDNDYQIPKPEPTEQDKINAMVFEQIATLQIEK